jgi:hypothetical protein
VIDHPAIDWSGWRTDLIAVGNWKVIGATPRALISRRHLIHSAPSVSVSVLGDLRIGVTAGVWLASARPGDRRDQQRPCFRAVGDVAASPASPSALTHQGLGATHEAPVSD